MEIRAPQDDRHDMVNRSHRRARRGAWSLAAFAMVASGCVARTSSTVSSSGKVGTVPVPTSTAPSPQPSTTVTRGHSLDRPGTSTTRTSSAPPTTTRSTTTRPTTAPPPTRTTPSTAPTTTRPKRASRATQVLAQLATVPVKGRAPKTGYSRDQFGPAWTDDVDVAGGHNGCDTRNDILQRDLTKLTFKAGTHDCVVLTGVLHGPYTGKTIFFQRGQRTSTAVQIDHVVALSDAWQKGAQQLERDAAPCARQRPARAARGRRSHERRQR